MKVKTAFKWVRVFSAGPAITVPAGAPVEWNPKNKQHYVVPSFFPEPLRNDADLYGCRVQADNVEEES